MTRNKSQLLTEVPFNALNKEDREKVKAIDSRYSNLLQMIENKSWKQVRRLIKPYVIYTSDSKITIMAGTKKNAIKMSGFKPRDITKITVEYADHIEELKLNVSKAKPKCKLQ